MGVVRCPSSAQLNPALSPGRGIVRWFAITPDQTAVVYLANQDTDDAIELYRVAFANPGVSTKLNPPLPAGRVVLHLVLTPDGTAVIYMADQDTDNVFDLYRVAVANPGVSTKLNGPLVTTGAISSFCVNAQCVLSNS